MKYFCKSALFSSFIFASFLTCAQVKGKPVTSSKTANPLKSALLKVSDFVTPAHSDSFYLYSGDRKIRYMVKYNLERASFMGNPYYNYFIYFGMGDEDKFMSFYFYTLTVSDNDAQIFTYAYTSSYSKKEQMVGGMNFIARIPLIGSAEQNWQNTIYDKSFNCSARLIDNVYQGKKNKCLVVHITSADKGGTVDETYYYQKGIGLIKIGSGNKVLVER